MWAAVSVAGGLQGEVERDELGGRERAEEVVGVVRAEGGRVEEGAGRDCDQGSVWTDGTVCDETAAGWCESS